MSKVKNKQLCPTCKTGQDTYLLDSRNPFCPYLNLHDGEKCSAYVRIKPDKKDET